MVCGEKVERLDGGGVSRVDGWVVCCFIIDEVDVNF